MKKYYSAYAVFLIPALLVALLFKNDSAASQILQWFSGFFMIFGFGAATYFAAYKYPAKAFSFILIYTGLNLAVFYAFYKSIYGSALYVFLRDYGGALSYVPLGIFVDTLNASTSNIEVYIILTVAASMLFGFLCALIKRRVKPYPYRPRIESN